MEEVTKARFKDLYLRLGGGEASGWTLERWDQFFETGTDRRYRVEEPESPAHTCMEIDIDYRARSCRMFFITPESEPAYFDTHRLEAFRKDVFIDYPFEDSKYRFEKKTGKYFARPYGGAESEIEPTNRLFREALSSGRLITREEYSE